MRWNAKLFSLIVVLGLFGCVQTYSSKDLSDSSNAMTVEQARRIVADEIPRAIHFSDAQIQSVRATRRQIYIYTTKMTYIIKYIYIEDKFSFYDSGVWIYVSDQNPVLWGDILLNPLNSPLQLARALLTLKQAAIAADTLPTADEKSRFVEIAAAYRAASPKPSLPETARKFQVQAEGAVRDKDFDDAEFYFNQALEVAPWWPDGHYNRALMLAELGEYEMAILEMQNYLALVLLTLLKIRHYSPQSPA